MVNRVLLNNSALSVSQAGVNVLSATPAQLLFSSDWNAMGVVQQGTYTIGTGNWTGSNTNFRSHTGTITLNKTFTSPPFCAFFNVVSGAMIPVGFGSGAFFGGVRGSGGSGGEDCTLVHTQVGTSSITVQAIYDKQYTPSLAVPTFSIRYFVFDYNT